jgi:hypothetical protein
MPQTKEEKEKYARRKGDRLMPRIWLCAALGLILATALAMEHAGAEGVGVDADGNVCGGVVRRQVLERHVRK